jgi:5S rRNA maturation endonuclease (ribonuclease M5)
LGIEDRDNLLFDKFNLVVEGDEDKIYLSKLMQHFGIAVPNIIVCNGADNMPKYLEFYDSIAANEDKNHFLAIFDNDEKGREVSKKIKAEKYVNIIVDKKFIVSYSGINPEIDQNGNCSANIEIEDFIKPQILCYLVNKILKQKKLKEYSSANIKEISNNIIRPAFQNNGIMTLLENKKNELNPDDGQNISISGQGVKGGVAKIFNELDSNIIKMIGDAADIDNKVMVEFLNEISNYADK